MNLKLSQIPPTTMVVHIVEAPDPATAMRVVDEARALVLEGQADRMMLDLSQQVSSSLTAAMARNLLVKVNDRLKVDVGRTDRIFPIAIYATLGSFGHGIGRMISGHAYGLTQLDVRQFEDRQEAVDWLTLADTIA